MRLPRLLVPLFAFCCLGFAERPPAVSVRFYAEANSRDGSSFSSPIKLGNPPHDAFLQKIPIVDERMVHAIYPFQAPDGTWGCAFVLDHDGRINLEVISTDHRGSYLVGFFGTKRGSHRMTDLIIDRTVTDGVISVPRGLTDTEIAILAKEFKVTGHAKVPKVKFDPRDLNPFQKKEKEAGE